MQLTIITACFNSSKTIRQLLESLHSSELNNFEHLIIDGNSSDSTVEIIKNFIELRNLENIRIFSEEDNGIYDALNKGIQLSSGDVIGFLHSDDLLYNSKTLDIIMNHIEGTDLDGVYGDLQYFDENLTEVIRNWRSCRFSRNLLKSGWMPPHPTLFLRKSVYSEYGNFDLKYKISADYEFILRIFKCNKLKIDYLPKVITKMRIGGISNNSLKNIYRKSLEDFKIIKIHQIGGVLTLLKKNLSKLRQFFIKNNFSNNER